MRMSSNPIPSQTPTPSLLLIKRIATACLTLSIPSFPKWDSLMKLVISQRELGPVAPVSLYPANTNVLYVDLRRVFEKLKEEISNEKVAFPGMYSSDQLSLAWLGCVVALFFWF